MSMKLASRTLVPVVLILVFGLIVGGITPASGQTSGSTSTLADAGVLRLRLGPQDHFRFESLSGSATTRSITVANGCRVASQTSPALVSFSTDPTNAFTGLVSDGIGVRGSGEGNGQPCGRIDDSQKLIMNLGPGLDGKLIDFAEIDVELKFAATLSIQGYLVDEEGVASPVGSPSTYDSTGSDSGPDSGDNDNYRVRFPEDGSFTAVNRLVFSIATTGAASLEGGADGTEACDATDSAACDPGLGQTIDDDPTTEVIETTSDSLFHLVEADGVLDCDDNDPESGGFTQGGDGTPLTTIERFDNADGSTCVPIPYNQDSNTGTEFCDPEGEFFLQCILLQKDLLGQDAQFLWTVAWEPEEGEYQESETEFDFGNGFQTLQLCLADTDEDGDPGFGLPELPPTADPGDPPTALDPWCVVSTSTDLQIDTGLVIVTETFYGRGDPTGRR